MAPEGAQHGAGRVPRPEELDAVIFDLDGVLTDTADLHFRAWQETFDQFLSARAEETGSPFEPFTRDDYRRHVDGKPRYEGARAFLRARGIGLPFGDPEDAAGWNSVCALGNRKNERYQKRLEEGELDAFPGSVDLVRRLRAAGVGTAVVTSSRNGRTVLEATRMADLFDAVVDGTDLAEAPSLSGKPAPDLFLEAARRLEVEPGRTVVVEDSISGVEAGDRGGFRLVIGVARYQEGTALERAGADLVVSDLSQIPLAWGVGGEASRGPPDREDPGTHGDRREG